jgi:hypothetical protein
MHASGMPAERFPTRNFTLDLDAGTTRNKTQANPVSTAPIHSELSCTSSEPRAKNRTIA